MAASRPAFLVPRLALILFVGYGIMGSWTPVFSLYLQKTLHFSPVAIGWSCATMSLGALVGPLTWGQVADRWLATERCISLCALADLVLLLVLAELSEPAAVFAVSVAFWFFMIPILSLGVSLAFRQLPHPESEFGKVRVWGTVGWVSANWLLSLWLSHGRLWLLGETGEDLGDSIRLGAAYAFVTGLYALTLPHTPPSPAAVPADARTLRRLFDAPLRAFQLLRTASLALFAACFFGTYVTMTFTTQMNPLLLSRHGVADAQIPLALTVAQSSEIVAIALLPRLLGSLGFKRAMALGLAAWALGLLLLTWGQPVWLVLLAFATHGLYICGFVVVGQLYVNREAGPDFRASAQGLLQLVSGLGLLVGNVAVGWIRELSGNNFTLSYAPAAAVAVLLAVLFLVGFGPKRTTWV